MRCISCIGKTREEKTVFCRQERCIRTDLVQEAVWHCFAPEEMILVLQDPNHAYIAAECEARGIAVRKIWIPEGTGGDELWETFTLLGRTAEEGEEILFDITGGCHAIPFLISLLASYLREIRHARIAGMVYAGNPDEVGMRHFIDLKPLMGVTDWISGMKALTGHTDATLIRRHLSGLQAELHRTRPEDRPPVRIAGWAHLIGTFTHAVRLSRPTDALYAAWGIIRDLPLVREEIARFAPALTPVLSDMESIGHIGAPPPEGGITPGYLLVQLDLIRYQIEKGFDIQAATLSREWLISCVMILLGIGEQWLDPEIRHTVSRTLTGAALTLQGKEAEDTQYTSSFLKEPAYQDMVRIWVRTSDLRNDLAHCGMNRRNESLKSLLSRTAAMPDDLLTFLQYTGIDVSKPH